MNICVCGYYGMGNFGDELFLETLRQVFNNHNIFAWHGTLDPDQIDAVIVGGGDIITPYYLNPYYFPDSLKNHPTWIFGVGVVSHYSQETWPKEEIEKSRERMQKAQRFVVRDEKSAQLAYDIGLHHQVEVHPDIAFSYKAKPYPILKSRYRRLLGVCVHAYDNYPLESIAELLIAYSREGYQIVIIPIVNQNNRFSDIGVCKLLKDKIEKKVGKASTLLLSPEYNLELIHSWIHSLDFLISSKLHPSLVALMGGVPVLCLSDQKKVSVLMEQYGLGEYALDIHISEDILKEKFNQFLLESTEKVREATPFIQETVLKSNNILKKLKQEIENYVLTNSVSD